ncbi:MAG: hypothetical protein RBT71_00865, partial [Flavobacteriales bacterium]|nr:hypothetical protein [Flavobacteriales bacterium]
MKNTVHTLSALALLAATAPVQAQTFHIADVQFWVGAGPDSSVLVVDFQDGSFNPSFAWGYLHDGTATGEDMLNAIAAADVNVTVDIDGGFLNSITYNDQAGIGSSPDWWGTWSGTGIADLEMNMGISEVLSNGSWFGCSYTDFNPPLEPTTPIAAFDPFRFTADDVTFWVGSGANEAVLVVDFQDGTGTSSYAWGYRFDGATTGEAMLNAVADADPNFAIVVGGGFLSDITYNSYAGIGGSPDHWSTWSGTNLGNWYMNMGIGTAVADGDLFGCSYTDFAPALRPYYPAAATGSTSIAEQRANDLLVYPQPATDVLTIRTEAVS